MRRKSVIHPSISSSTVDRFTVRPEDELKPDHMCEKDFSLRENFHKVFWHSFSSPWPWSDLRSSDWHFRLHRLIIVFSLQYTHCSRVHIHTRAHAHTKMVAESLNLIKLPFPVEIGCLAHTQTYTVSVVCIQKSQQSELMPYAGFLTLFWGFQS